MKLHVSLQADSDYSEWSMIISEPRFSNLLCAFKNSIGSWDIYPIFHLMVSYSTAF